MYSGWPPARRRTGPGPRLLPASNSPFIRIAGRQETAVLNFKYDRIDLRTGSRVLKPRYSSRERQKNEQAEQNKEYRTCCDQHFPARASDSPSIDWVQHFGSTPVSKFQRAGQRLQQHFSLFLYFPVQPANHPDQRL
jgi:hypothetical protein